MGRQRAQPRGEGADRPRSTLERKLVVWTAILIVVPTFVSALWLNYQTRDALRRSHANNVALLGQTASASLSGQISPDFTARAMAVVDSVALDHRFSFVLVSDAEGRPVHLRVGEDPAWAAYHRWVEDAGPAAAAAMDRAIPLGAGDLVAWKLPIWKSPTPQGDREIAQELEGFLVLAMRDRSLNATLGALQASELTAAGLVSLISIPIVVLAVRRWTSPLRLLVDATRRLAAGESPQPVPTRARDDLGLLTDAFNDMAVKLSAAQGELRAANADLEDKVAARTGELERAKRELESEIRDKNEFLRAVSHDLGAPLRNIGGMATMLLMKYRTTLADDALNKLERINANVKAQTELINDLLELSRIKTRPGKRSEVDLHALVQELVEALSFDLDRNKIELKVEGRLPTIVADRNRVRQVFQNLLDNAIKYMLDAPTRRIRVSYQSEGGHYHFLIADTGRGISEDDLPNLFQIYRRATHSGSHQVQGRGVGLASVKSIVETYGGRIWAESDLGKGSTFHFTFEKSKVSGRATDPPNAMESGVWAAVGGPPRR